MRIGTETSAMARQSISRAANSGRAALDVLVPQQFLNCSDDRHSRVELFTTPSLSEIPALATGYGN